MLVALVVALFAVIQSAHAAPAITVEFSDSDGIVADGTSVMVFVRDASTGDAEDQLSGFVVTAVTVSGELAGTELPGVTLTSTAILSKTAEQTEDTRALTITIPKGTPAGKYVVSATATDASTDPDTVISDDATLTVGDPGTGVASVEISYRKSHIATADVDAGTRTCGDAPAHAGDTPTEEELAQDKSERTDDASAPAEEPICLTATVKNSLGKTANDSDVKLLFITTEGGTWTGTGVDTATTVSAVPDDDRAAKYNFQVTASKAAMVTVEVDAGPAEGELELTFTGAAETLSIGDASDVLARSGDAYTPAVAADPDATPAVVGKDAVEGGVIFEAMATDKAGNNVDLAPDDVTAVKITDGDDKDVTSKFNTANEMQKPGNPQVVLVRVGTGDTKVAAGEYTATISLTEVVDSKVSATFRVADVPANVALEASAMTSDTIGDVITVTATVTDESGNAVADGTGVDFDVSSNTGLAGIGKGHGDDDTVDTKGGTAMVKFAVVGAGNSVVSATAGGATGVVVITSTAGSTAAMEDTDPSLSDLSGTSGLVSYSGPDTTASALLALLAGRANAIWLSNNGGWVLYANVDGAMVPGSTDFAVTSGDVLYISN